MRCLGGVLIAYIDFGTRETIFCTQVILYVAHYSINFSAQFGGVFKDNAAKEAIREVYT